MKFFFFLWDPMRENGSLYMSHGIFYLEDNFEYCDIYFCNLQKGLMFSLVC